MLARRSPCPPDCPADCSPDGPSDVGPGVRPGTGTRYALEPGAGKGCDRKHTPAPGRIEPRRRWTGPPAERTRRRSAHLRRGGRPSTPRWSAGTDRAPVESPPPWTESTARPIVGPVLPADRAVVTPPATRTALRIECRTATTRDPPNRSGRATGRDLATPTSPTRPRRPDLAGPEGWRVPDTGRTGRRRRAGSRPPATTDRRYWSCPP